MTLTAIQIEMFQDLFEMKLDIIVEKHAGIITIYDEARQGQSCCQPPKPNEYNS